MTDVLKELSDAMASTVESISLSIVRVAARRRLPATGIVWSADGIIVTANHVVEQEEDIAIGLHDDSTVKASLVGRDPQNDLAVLRVDESVNLTAAAWGQNESLKVGNLVLALGKPGSQVQATLGVVSALVGGDERPTRRGPKGGPRGKRGRRRGRGGMMGRALVDGFVQTDVVMYPGFSGGPLVSGDGSVHGLNTSGFARGISIAVPVATIRNTVETLMTHGKMKQGYLGIGVQPVRLPDNISEELDQETGLLVVSVESNSPASSAGLLVGDIVVALDGESTEQMDELLMLLQGERVGKEVPVGIVRGGVMQDVSVTVGERD